MKILLIYSHNLNHIAISLENIKQEFISMLQAQEKNTNAFKQFFFKEVLNCNIYTEKAENPSFKDIIENQEIQIVFTYFEEIKSISFAFMEKGKIIQENTLKEFLKDNSFESLENLLLGENNDN